MPEHDPASSARAGAGTTLDNPQSAVIRALEAPRQSLAYRHDRGPGRLHGGARHFHRQRRPAPHRRLARRQHRRGNLGPHQLPRRQRHRPAPRRLGLQRHGPPQLLRLLHHRLYRCQFPLRLGSIAAHPSHLPHHSGLRRRRHAAHGPGHHGRLLRTAEARPGLCSLRHRRRPRSLHRPHPGRLDHRQLFLALDLLHQHPGRHSGLHSGQPAGRRSAVDQSRLLPAAQHGLPRPQLSHHRHGRPADHARQGRGERLVLLRLHSLLRLPIRCRHDRPHSAGSGATKIRSSTSSYSASKTSPFVASSWHWSAACSTPTPFSSHSFCSNCWATTPPPPAWRSPQAALRCWS